MQKAIFMDYYGTVAHELGPIAQKVVKRIYETGTAASMEAILGFWWKIFRERLSLANGEKFRSQHDVAMECFCHITEHFQSTEDPRELLAQMEEHWRTTEIYPDVPGFLEEVRLPVYFVTNCDDDYVLANIQKHRLHPAGIITSEQAKFSKPRKEIFLYALEKTGLSHEEVIHIGDSISGDVKCPTSVGIQAIWLNREHREVPEGVSSASGLQEILPMLSQR